ncbi:hypothetical protein NFI96_001035 [Prochilodus magdalenae]|nr:hypothetical protein NFI96_001035 [Prochilodus magdalenae]
MLRSNGLWTGWWFLPVSNPKTEPVLELLCQILQTDSLSLVQQWLLLAGDREKELVLGLLQQAMSDPPNLNQHQELPFTAQTEQGLPLNPATGLSRRKRRLKRTPTGPPQSRYDVGGGSFSPLQ